jgi:hypothetical protein
MKVIFSAFLILYTYLTSGQTYSRVISDSEIINFINADILRDSIKIIKSVKREIIRLNLDDFYYKDSLDFTNKNATSFRFIFQYHRDYKDREVTYHLDTLFSRKDIDYFLQQIEGITKQKYWEQPFLNSVLIDNVKLDSNRYAKKIMYLYSLPLFSADKKHVIIIKSFFCGFLCGGGAYYLYEKDINNNWYLVRTLYEWGE